MLRVVVALLLLIVLPALAHAEKRVALVIGNGAYTKVTKLENPKNDAAAMEAVFKAAGFDTVVRVNDLGVAAMRRALRDFSDTAHDADIAVVFYAGHGIEVSGTNYLIPTDAVLERDLDVQDEAVSLDRVNQILEQVKHLRLVILDACRDNPFVRSMRRTLTTRTVRSGYGEIDERSLPPNTLVAYAQRAGATAEDGVGANSPYTTALLKHLLTPGLDVELALRRVRDEVLKSTRNRQEPFKYGSLGGGEIALVAAKPEPVVAPEAKVPPSSSGLGGLRDVAEAWDRTKDATSVAALEAFLARFKDTYYADLARLRIEELKKQQAAVAVPPKVAPVAPVANPAVAIAPQPSDELKKKQADEKKKQALQFQEERRKLRIEAIGKRLAGEVFFREFRSGDLAADYYYTFQGGTNVRKEQRDLKTGISTVWELTMYPFPGDDAENHFGLEHCKFEVSSDGKVIRVLTGAIEHDVGEVWTQARRPR